MKIDERIKEIHNLHAKRIDEKGVYLPHQPIYEFEPMAIDEYYRMYAILNSIDCSETFIDIGCAEGIYLSMAENFCNSKVFGLDVSSEVLKRMVDFFGFSGVAGSGTMLPFKNRSFDTILCSEVIEHVTEPEKLAKELRRIAKNQIIISTPIAKSRAEKESFEPDKELKGNTHLHFFGKQDMEKMFGKIEITYAQSGILYPANIIYRRAVRFFDKALGYPIARLLIRMDAWLCKKYPWSGKAGIVIVGKRSEKKIPAGFIVSGMYKKISEQRKTDKIRLQNKKTFLMKDYGYLISKSS